MRRRFPIVRRDPDFHGKRPNGSVYRIVASGDGTTVTQDGVPLGTINRGQFIEVGPLPGAHVFEGDQPIFVTQFMTSDNNPDATLGDPAQGNMIPAEQFLPAYTFSTVGGDQFAENYVTIIANNADVGSLTLDGVPIAAADYTPIGASGYSYTIKPLTLGTHTTASANGHGITVEGYNNYDSYIYPGGALFKVVKVLPLVANQWQFTGLPLNVGNANTVQNVFGDDLNPATYGDSWGLYDWDAGTEQYIWLNLNDPLVEGKGYWLMTLDSGQSIDVEGIPNPVPLDIPLVGDPAGRLNMVGYPYVTAGCWANAKVVVDGEDEPRSLDQADPAGTCWTAPDPNCVLSRIMYTWNGAAYQSHDGQTPGTGRSLSAFEGLWVNAFKDDIKLRLANTPCATPMTASTLNAATPSAEWWLRLIVASGDLQDPGNLLGRLSDSRSGYDAHDLPELAPAASPSLTIVFPYPDRGAQAGDFTTDYRQAGRRFQGGAWNFEVRSDVARTVTLYGEGSAKALARSRLFDRETRQWLRPDGEGRYTVTMVGPVHRLRWQVR